MRHDMQLLSLMSLTSRDLPVEVVMPMTHLRAHVVNEINLPSCSIMLSASIDLSLSI